MTSSAKFTTNIQTQQLTALGTSRAGPIYLYAAKLGARVMTQAARNLSGRMVKVRTGNLRSSGHTTTVVTGAKLIESVIYDAEYALAVHEGQKPHDIDPKGARVLAWTPAGGGTTQFAARVHHPGARGRPFLSDALSVINE